MAERLEHRQIVPGGEIYEFAGDHIAFSGAPGVLEGLYESGVEREYEHAGVVEVSGESFGFPRCLGSPAVSASAMLQPDGGEETCAKRG
ncbi:hypothetical protein [Streptomyces sp. NPDC091299]|uniref:hypothetical protein n=1 Tax=Streptomyces sp. NPDC091299 TaxID=3155302 RepID=UPI0034330815